MKLIFIPQIMNLKIFATLTFAFITSIFSGSPVQAIQFNFTYGEGTSQEVIDGFEAAGNIWSSKFKDTFFDSSCYCEQDIKVNIRIDFTQLTNPKGLGAASPTMVSVDYEKFLNRMFKDITSEDDLTAFKNLQNIQYKEQNFLKALGVDLKKKIFSNNLKILQTQGFEINTTFNNIESNSNDIIANQVEDIFQQLNLQQLENLDRTRVKFDSSNFKMLIDDDSSVDVKDRDKVDKVQKLDSETIIDQNDNDNNKKIWLTLANAKALGLSNGDDNEGFDARILLSNAMFANNGNIISNSDWLTQNPEGNFLESTIWDFSRVMNLNAEVANDKFDFLSVALHEIGHALGVVSGVDAFKLLKMEAEGNSTTLSENEIALVSPMDLFRFSEESKQSGVFDWSSRRQTFLSIDGGQTKIADFADGVSYQTSHWSENGDINGNTLGIMHPVLGRGEKLDITDLDLQLLDVLGYTKVEDQENRWLHQLTQKQKKLKKLLAKARLRMKYNYASSSNRGFSFWQEIDSLEGSEYNEVLLTEEFTEENFVEDGYSVFFHQEYRIATTPEPNILTGLGILSLFGWLTRRVRRD